MRVSSALITLALLAAPVCSTSAGATGDRSANRSQEMPTPTPLILGPQIDPALRTPTPLPVDPAVPPIAPSQTATAPAAMQEMPAMQEQPPIHGMPNAMEQTDAAAPTLPGALVATLGANVRNMPHRAGSQVLTVLLRGDTVTLTGQLADRTWFRVLRPSVDGQPSVEGWMHHSVVDVDPATLGRIPVAAGELIAGGMTMLLPAPADAHMGSGDAERTPVVPAPEVSSVPSASGVIVTQMPDGLPDSVLPATQPTVPLSLVLRACYDGNRNRACDVDEGIAGLTVYATDPLTAGLLGQALTDAGGIARLTVRVARDGQVAVTVPYFGATQTTTGARQLQPVIVSKPVPIPALLP